MIYKKIFLIVTIAISLLNAEGRCQNSANYYEKNFASASNPEAFNLAWARCEKSLGNDEASISAYERVLLYNPNNIEAIFALVPLYKKIGMDREIKSVFADIDETTLTLAQKKELSSLKGEQSMGIATTISASIDYGYDTNLNYNVFTQNSILPVASRQESSFYTLHLKGGASYNFESDSSYSLQTNLELYKKDNKEGSYFDLSYAKLDMGVGYNTQTLSIYLPIVYSRVNYLDRDLYQQLGVAPKFTMQIDSGLLLNLGVQYTKREYINTTDKGADDTLIDASIGLYRFFGDSFIYAQFDYGTNKADSSIPSTFTEYDFFHIFAGINYKLEEYNANWGVNYLYSRRDYSDNIVSTTDKRLDEFQQINIYIKKALTSNWDIKLEYSYLNNSSNYALIDYDKQISSISLEYRY